MAASWIPLNRTERVLLLAIAIVVAGTTLLDSQHNYWFDPATSAKDILRQTVMLGIFALGSAIVIISGGIDLSCGSVIAFSGTVCASLLVLLAPEEMNTTNPRLPLGVISAAVAGTLTVGFLIGSLHAWLITVVGLPPFVATLATLVGLRSFGRAIIETVTVTMLKGSSTKIAINDPRFRYLTTSEWIPVLLFLVLAALAWLLLSRTVTGRRLYALGGNEQAARLSGIRTDRLKWLAYCIGAVLSSLAGILYICEISSADPQTLGRGYELNAIAAAVVGGCSLQGGVGTIPGTVLGALFLRTIVDGVSKIIKRNADVYEGMIVGIVVVMAVAINQLRQAGQRGKEFFPGMLGLVTIFNLVLLAGSFALLIARNVLEQDSQLQPATVGAAVGVLALAVLVAIKVLEKRGRRSR